MKFTQSQGVNENFYEQLALIGFARKFFAKQGGGRMSILCVLTRTTTLLCVKLAVKTIEEAVRKCSKGFERKISWVYGIGGLYSKYTGKSSFGADT
jgi:hypothetical protein